MTGKTSNADLLIVGSVAFDSIQTLAGGVDKALGGSATYASLSASYFAAPRVVGIVGDDFGDEHFSRLQARGVDTSGINKVPGGETFHWKGKYHENMQDRDTLETHLNVFEGFDPVLSAEFKKSSHLFLGNIDPKLQLKVLDQIEKPRFVGMDTMNFWISDALDDLMAVFKRVDALFINDEESFQITGERLVANAAKKILELGPTYVIIKRGEHGAFLFGPEACLFCPAMLLSDVVDPTGAGDSFAGGFMGYIAGVEKIDRLSLLQAMRTGTVMASFVCEKFSVDGLDDLDKSQIVARQDVLKSMVVGS